MLLALALTGLTTFPMPVLGSTWIVDDPARAWTSRRSRLHAARSSFVGGNGGDSNCAEPSLVEPAGTGGSGIELAGVATLLLSGLAQHVLVGGAGGIQQFAPSGHGLFVATNCAARISGVSVATSPTQGTGTITTPPMSDPTLRLLEPVVPGANSTFRIAAPAGSSARIAVGAVPTVTPSVGVVEDALVARAKVENLGTIPATGVLGWNFAVPAQWQVGATVFVQATLTYPGGEFRRTHSVVAVVH